MSTEDNYIFLHVMKATNKDERGRRVYRIHGRFDKKLPSNLGQQLKKIPGVNMAVSQDYHVAILPGSSANLHELDEAIRKEIITFINATAAKESAKWSKDSPLKTFRTLRSSADENLT